MKETNENKKPAPQEQEKEKAKESSPVAADWAEIASQELSDYIEEQGIQIRY